METQETKRYVLAAIDGYGRIIAIKDKVEVKVRNSRHFEALIKEAEAGSNATNTLKANRFASVSCFVVDTFEEKVEDQEAVYLNKILVAQDLEKKAIAKSYMEKRTKKEPVTTGGEND